jgi:FtsP/CotA-like multicopper oxidase with cupredoxin domain
MHRLLFLIALVAAAGLPPAGPHLWAQALPPAGDFIQPTTTVASGDHGGMFFGHPPNLPHTRRYYIAAEPVVWDFLPSGRDEVCGNSIPPTIAANREQPMLRYVQYTDATFTRKVPANPSLGILGPVLRGVVGDYLAVTFLNRTNQPLSLHPHGVHYDKDSEGAYYQPMPGKGAAVAPGARFTYVWQLDESSGPLPGEPSSKAWLYHSHVNNDAETNLGLIGLIIVTDPRRARPDGTPSDVDREFATLFMIFDTTAPGPVPPPTAAALAPGDAAGALLLARAKAAANQPAAPPKGSADEQAATEAGQRFAINGRIYGNLPGLEMNEGERVRWYLLDLGSESDLHTPHWHGVRLLENGVRRTDVMELLPATMKVADLVADNPGSWLFHCHVAEHMNGGMFARFVIYPHDAVGADRSPAHAFLGFPLPLLLP